MLARLPATSAPELEIKFQLGAGAADALQDQVFPLSKASVSQLRATYFDTPGHALRDGGFSLRVRRKDDQFIQTLKHRGDGGLFERDEWETPVTGPELDLEALRGTSVLGAIGAEPLQPAFRVEVERRTHLWVDGDTRVEVSFDEGRILADGREEPIAELELELLAGLPTYLFALARELHGKAGLTLLFESKAERGYRLAGHDGVAALRAQQTAVGPDALGGEAFRAIAREALVQAAGNARLLQRSPNPEALHQLRVGLRRLRAALSVFKPMLDAPGLEAARGETRWLAGELGDARDLDVFLQVAPPADEIDEDPARAAFFAALRRAQASAYERALVALRCDRFRQLLLNLGEWIEVGDWSRLDAPQLQALRDGPVARLAVPRLGKLDTRLRRQGALSKLQPEARHEFRKQVKKLRYAAAFFGGVFPDRPKRRQRFIAALKVLQDRLGELNDIDVARAAALRIAAGRSGEMAFAAGLEAGRLAAREGELLAASDQALKAFRRTRPFWETLPGAA